MSATSIARRHIIFLSLILVFVVILSTEARAETYGFKNITNNNVVDTAFYSFISEKEIY
jgi:hypothetical protein